MYTFKKILSFIVCLTLAFISVFETGVISAFAAGKTLTANEIGTADGYSYELWKDSGNTTMTLGSGGTFDCKWDSINNALFRRGIKLDSTKTYKDLGSVKVDYNCDYNPSGNSYLCVYGWSVDPLIEYYIVDSWGTWRPPGGTSKGTINVDGGTYDIYETTRVNQPSIQGTATFKQYWSVRTSKRTSGTISVDKHFKAWEEKGMSLGKLYEVALTVEGYQSSGSANVTKNILTLGASDTTTDNKDSNANNKDTNTDNKDTNTDKNTNDSDKKDESNTSEDVKPDNNSDKDSNNWVNNADISWIDSSKKVVAFTFDDGPVGTASNSSSQRILDVMEKYKMHCTFFYIGNKINDSTKDEISRAYSLGCEVGNHTYTHADLTKISKDDMLSEISKTNDLLSDITKQSSTLVRAPYGSVNSDVLSTINAPFINWSLDSTDWNNGTYDNVLNTIRKNIKDGSIILMHETYDFTAQAVETLVPELIEQGYQIVSVSELMKIKNVALNNGELYKNNAENKPNVVDKDSNKDDTSTESDKNNVDNDKINADKDKLDEDTPQTGDTSYIVLASAVLVITGLFALIYKFKKKNVAF